MRKMTIKLAVVGMLSSWSAQANTVEDRAASIWFNFNDVGRGNTIMQDVYVPSNGLTKYTYYSVLNWNAGMEGGGYAGIQDHPDGRNYIFSIWDPRSSSKPIVARYLGHGTESENFGGEGTGLKTWNFDLGWQANQWYTLVAKAWPVGSHTHFGYWVHDQAAGEWSHLVTMDYPVADVRFETTTGSFVEDWWYSGENARTVRLKNGHKKLENGSWIGFDSANFSVVQHQPKRNYDNNYDASANLSYFTMTTGGTTSPTLSISNQTCRDAYGNLTAFCGRNSLFPLTRNNVADTPNQPNIEFTITDATTRSVSWQVPQTSTPQFSYSVMINNVLVASASQPEKRQVDIIASENDNVIITLEDIFGRTVSHSATVTIDNTSAQHYLIDSATLTVSSNSQSEPYHELANAFDGDKTTLWHTSWSTPQVPSYPHGVIIDLGKHYELSELHYTPRAVGENGSIADYEVYVSHDGVTYDELVAAGTWDASKQGKVVALNNTQTRFIKLVGLSEVNANVWASAAEIELYHTGKLDSSSFVVSSDSQAELGEEIIYAFDNNPATIWHTNWSGSTVPEYPHSVDIDLGNPQSFSKITYLPRTIGVNGTIADYEVYVSDDGINFGSPIAVGTWAANTKIKQTQFTPVTARYIRLIAQSEINGRIWASAAEIAVYK
ncbi:discoidin domain-containing protein [uncultured Pseudoalteromonas sp.]|uniref:DUF3472 domain-containing protein n=1 Tax=uncultured Pseudoalteromonas sp. TaxID=114053 RepID=UPI00260BDCB8|nr:discoidin domain-containing protein [uncultured Pseudoalteromonas sp.]